MNAFRWTSMAAVLCAMIGAVALRSPRKFVENDAPNAVAKSALVVRKTQITPARLVRPRYDLDATVDFAARTLKSEATIEVPIAPRESLRDVVFFIYANANGVGGATEKKPNLVVDSVTQNGKPLKWTRRGAILRATFLTPQTQDATLKVKYHGTVPLAPPQSEGLGEMLGGLDLNEIFGGLMGGNSTKSTTSSTRADNTDYGLFTKSNAILSLGSFWYPALAVRKNGKWIDKPPAGLGDVAFADASDFEVSLKTPRAQKLTIASSGETAQVKQSANRLFDAHVFRAENARDFAVLMSDKYQAKSKIFDVGGKKVTVQAFTTKANAAKTDAAIDFAGRALQIFSKRFGAYPSSHFTVAEAPLRGGAGGIEYSNMTGIASMLYGDLGKQIDDLVGMLGGNSAMLGDVMKEQKVTLDSMFEMTIAHEVAHQWWAIGVGSDSQNAPWVDESLTNYSATIYFEDRYGAVRAAQMREAHLKSGYTMARMFGILDAPVRGASSGFKSNLQYGAVVYSKGALFYGELRKLVGDEIFFASLRQYFTDFSGKLADESSLKNIFIKNAPTKKSAVESLYQRWIDETHGDEDLASSPASATNGTQDLGNGELSSLLEALESGA